MTFPPELIQDLEQLAALASQQLQDALAAFAAQDADQAQKIHRNDDAIDALHATIQSSASW